MGVRHGQVPAELRVGEKFGRLTVCSIVDGVRPKRCVCLCDCGRTTTPMLSNVTKGITRSCGCLLHARSNTARLRAAEQLCGKRFGQLVVLDIDSTVPSRWRAICRCDCGVTCAPLIANVRARYTRSCGCGMGKAGRTHGRARTALYHRWAGMIARCSNPNSSAFARYGGRGITVCDRWRDSFEAFASDMGEPPTPAHSIDRVDNDRGYEPGNCRWATQQEQSRNTSRNRYIEFGGERMLPAEWAAKLGISRQAFYQRLASGRPIADICSAPKQRETKGGLAMLDRKRREEISRMGHNARAAARAASQSPDPRAA